ncbi:hypothetical protein RchiOBHm_Chr7g0231521 [Rosa chinensis]|uniref:Uncharacterized protein n=1 Tax=Rosa chinensis TaxID=74649 RepID=A0A2P6PFR4_ROSCH|nr:hypothetical protein RchiOBHm_Chr7g0231521 [Rosa chinensis]
MSLIGSRMEPHQLLAFVSIYDSSTDKKVGVGSLMDKASAPPLPIGSVYMEDVHVKDVWTELGQICGQNFGFSNICFSESCSMWGDDVQKLLDLHSVRDYFLLRMEKRRNGEADLVVFCHKGSDSKKELGHPHSESTIFSEMEVLGDCGRAAIHTQGSTSNPFGFTFVYG